jgi:hypothetical protein
MKPILAHNLKFGNKANKQITPKLINKAKSPQTLDFINKTILNIGGRSIGSIGVKHK